MLCEWKLAYFIDLALFSVFQAAAVVLVWELVVKRLWKMVKEG